MTDRCEPPPEWRDHCWHWLKIHDNSIVAFWWNGEGWRRTLGSLDPVEMACAGYTYLAPCRLDDATERARLEAENARLQGLIRAILAADERGQGLPFADAMDAAQEAVYGKRT